MGSSASMPSRFPDVKDDEPLTSRRQGPSYSHTMNSTTADAVDGEDSKELTPHAPKEPDLPTPACMTDGSNAQLPRDFIAKWKVTDGNVVKRMKEISYTLNLLTNQDIDDLVQNSKSYDRDFYLLSKGMYKLHNSKYANRKLLLQTLLDEDIITFLKVYWAAIMKEFNAKKAETGSSLSAGELWEKYTTTQPHIVDALGNCYYILVVLWNGSDMQLPETLETLYNGTAAFLLERLSKDLYPVKVRAIHAQYKVVKACLGVIHNFCNKYEGAVVDLREKGALDIIGKYRDSGTLALKATSVLSYSYLLPEDDHKNKSSIELEKADIDFLIGVLRDALNENDGHSKKYGFHADELIVGLNNIAVIDSNKKRLVDAGVLPLYVEAMNRKKPSLQSCAAQGVWTLAFDSESKSKIMQEPGCIDALRNLAKSKIPEVKGAAEGALWKLEGETKHLQLISAQGQSDTAKKGGQGKLSHIMISYQWDVQDEVLQVRERLRKAGYRVWIDVEQMSGNTLESMAKAVENSALLVPVLTEKYKASVACRQELSYANQLKKKMVPLRLQPKYLPDGWLGLVMGNTFFYDLTNPNEYEKKISDFLKELGNDGKIKPGEDENPCYDDVVPETAPGLSMVPAQPITSSSDNQFTGANVKTVFNVTKLRCVSWSNDNVIEWLKTNGLDKCVKKFSGMNGKLLAELAAVQFISPDAYYSMMRQEHGLPMLDVLKLNAALRELNPSAP